MGVTLGRTVEQLTLYLIPSDPFVCEIVREDGQPWTDLPALEVAGQVWQSTGTGPVARFDVPAAQVDAAIASQDRRARLTVGGLVWAAGELTAVLRA